jgi:hypothetical protein
MATSEAEMGGKVITMKLRVGMAEPAAAPAAAGSAERRAAMLANLHAVLATSCPGLTPQGLEQMIGADAFNEILERIAMLKRLEEPQGHA